MCVCIPLTVFIVPFVNIATQRSELAAYIETFWPHININEQYPTLVSKCTGVSKVNDLRLVLNARYLYSEFL